MMGGAWWFNQEQVPTHSFSTPSFLFLSLSLPPFTPSPLFSLPNSNKKLFLFIHIIQHKCNDLSGTQTKKITTWFFLLLSLFNFWFVLHSPPYFIILVSASFAFALIFSLFLCVCVFVVLLFFACLHFFNPTMTF